MTSKEAITVLNMVECHCSLTAEAKDKAIEALSAQIHGQWIRVPMPIPYSHAVQCDQCNRISEHKSDFCPWCGADMKGGE